MKYKNIREEELKNKVGQDLFFAFDTTKIVGNIDFCVTHKNKSSHQVPLFETPSLLWAEAKRGTFDMLTMVTQLVLTVGKARTFDKFLPPAFLGAFDSEKIGFVPYNAISDIFSMNDFNWNVTPSNHETKEFAIVKERIDETFRKNHYVYNFEKDKEQLQFFIKNNIAKTTQDAKIAIDKNNFVSIYLRWLEHVKPCIDLKDWDKVKGVVLDRDFYLADLFVDDKGTSTIDDDVPLDKELFVVFRNGHYEIQNSDLKGFIDTGVNAIAIKDKATYEQFWKKYKRPPLEKFRDYINNRRDLLVPQDIRERRGAFFTPQKWVAMSQQYIADVLGDDWQDEYYVWDCAAGTGNLLLGLHNSYNIWASTLDQSDVNTMHDSIASGASLLLKKHVFQFDFLNDDFSKLPQGLQDIINDEEKRKKLVIYINPPYAEASSRDTVVGKGENKSSVATKSRVYGDFSNIVGTATRELFAQFFLRIYRDLPNVKLASFSTLKYISSQNFFKFKEYFKAEYLKGFICQADTFDNVKGKFPIGFLIWNTENKVKINKIVCDIFEENYLGQKSFYSFEKNIFIINWLRNFYDKKNERIAYLRMQGTDMQNNQGVFFTNNPTDNDLLKKLTTNITKNNVVEMSIYLTMRHFTEATWLNDRDQFLYPNDGWQTDSEFQNDCLAFALFHSQNKISASAGTNHWIPFTEQEVHAEEKFDSNFMTDFIKGKIKASSNPNELGEQMKLSLNSGPTFTEKAGQKLFSEKATHVFQAGRELWTYYHAQKEVNVNASLYDIREHFQGRNDKGKMNNKSGDATYMKLITQLRERLKILAKKIEPKVYEYGFLKE